MYSCCGVTPLTNTAERVTPYSTAFVALLILEARFERLLLSVSSACDSRSPADQCCNQRGRIKSLPWRHMLHKMDKASFLAAFYVVVVRAADFKTFAFWVENCKNLEITTSHTKMF